MVFQLWSIWTWNPMILSILLCHYRHQSPRLIEVESYKTVFSLICFLISICCSETGRGTGNLPFFQLCKPFVIDLMSKHTLTNFFFYRFPRISLKRGPQLCIFFSISANCFIWSTSDFNTGSISKYLELTSEYLELISETFRMYGDRHGFNGLWNLWCPSLRTFWVQILLAVKSTVPVWLSARQRRVGVHRSAKKSWVQPPLLMCQSTSVDFTRHFSPAKSFCAKHQICAYLWKYRLFLGI